MLSTKIIIISGISTDSEFDELKYSSEMSSNTEVCLQLGWISHILFTVDNDFQKTCVEESVI